jgi:protein phosphatase
LFSSFGYFSHDKHAAVHDEGLARELRGRQMATTIVACALRHDQAIVGHVGDSRCYHIRSGQACAVTRDHTWANEQRKLGLISPSVAGAAETRHMLTRSLGPEFFVTSDTNTVTLRAGGRPVLCSDGLYNGLADADIADIASQNKNPDQLARDLVNTAVVLLCCAP